MAEKDVELTGHPCVNSFVHSPHAVGSLQQKNSTSKRFTDIFLYPSIFKSLSLINAQVSILSDKASGLKQTQYLCQDARLMLTCHMNDPFWFVQW